MTIAKFACFLIVALWQLGCVVPAAAQGPVQSAHRQQSESTPPVDGLDAFRAELNALNAQIPDAWKMQFAEPASIPATIKRSVRDLSDRMLQLLQSKHQAQPSEFKELASWSSTFKEVFALRIMLEWQRFEPAWLNFHAVKNSLTERMQPIEKVERAKAIAAISDPILRLWLATQSHEILPWMQEFEDQSLVDDKGRLPTWWLRDRCDYTLTLVGRDSDLNNQAVGEKWLLAYLADTSAPVKRRAYTLTRYALHMHTLGKPDAAMRVLNHWAKLNPDACVDDIRFLHASFFVHQIGQADRQAARQVLDQLDRMVESGSISQEDDRFRIITQNYYRNLRHSDLEHAMLTSQLLESRNRQVPESQ